MDHPTPDNPPQPLEYEQRNTTISRRQYRVLLTLTLYIFVSAAIFLVGAQLDELLRKESRRGS